MFGLAGLTGTRVLAPSDGGTGEDQPGVIVTEDGVAILLEENGPLTVEEEE